MTKIAIIGAGLSGLTAAKKLKNVADITLFEKSRGVSGRISTRRAEPYQFDHGAQFFKVRSDLFQSFIDPMIEAGVVERWDARFVEIVNGDITQKRQWGADYPHYVGVSGMNAVGKWLSQDLVINCNTRVSNMVKQGNQWSLYDEQDKELGVFDWVISSLPAEQAAVLLPSTSAFDQQLKSVTMKSCFSLMLGFKDDLSLTFDAALVRGVNISWISVNSSKPGRNSDHYCLLVHSTNNWADAHIDDDRVQVLDYLCRQTSDVIGQDVSRADYKAVHGWRFANIDKQNGETHLVDQEACIGVCGDWLIQGRVEAAFISGHELANSLLKVIEHD